MRLRPELRQFLIRSVPALFAIPLGFVAFFGATITRRLASGRPVTVESLGAAQESCGVTQLLLLALVGCVIASFTDSPALMIGFLTVVGLPIWSLIDAANAYKHGVESHNLLGIEWVFYAAYGAFPAGGAFLIRRAGGRRGGRTQ